MTVSPTVASRRYYSRATSVLQFFTRFPLEKNLIWGVKVFRALKFSSWENEMISLQTHPCNENRFFPVRKTSQGIPRFHYRAQWSIRWTSQKKIKYLFLVTNFFKYVYFNLSCPELRWLQFFSHNSQGNTSTP